MAERRTYEKGLKALGNGLHAWLQPDRGCGWSNARLDRLAVRARNRLAIPFVLLTLAGCVLAEDLGARTRYVELVAPASFRADGEPWKINDFGGWDIVRASGCIRPGETVRVEVLQKAALTAAIPSGFVEISPVGEHPADHEPIRLAGARGAVVTGTGSADDPYIVRWSNLERWQAFIDDWERYPSSRIEYARSFKPYMEFTADPARLRAITNMQELHALFTERPDVQQNYHA